MPIELPESVKELELTPKKLLYLWKKFDAISGLFDDYRRHNFGAFKREILRRDSYWLEFGDLDGVFYMEDIIKGLSASGHLVFFDRVLKGREELVMDVIRYCMAGADLKKLNIYLPDYAVQARRFAQRLGFRREGKIRRASYIRGRLYDMFVYGMTREEAFDGTDRIQGAEVNGERLGGRNPELVRQPAGSPSVSSGSAGEPGVDAAPDGSGNDREPVHAGLLPDDDVGRGTAERGDSRPREPELSGEHAGRS